MMKRLIFYIIPLFLLLSTLQADQRYGSISGNFILDAGNDGNAELTLTSSGNLGVNNSNPNHALDVSGNVDISGTLKVQNLIVTGQSYNTIQTLTGNATLGDTATVLANTNTQSDIKITLPNASDHNGQVYEIKNTGTGNVYLISTDSIDQDVQKQLNSSGTVKLISNGTKWFSLTSTSATTIASDNLVGWWKLDETSGTTITDSSSYLSHGSIANDKRSNGVFNGAVNFNHPNDHLRIPDPADGHLDMGTSDFSLSFWYYALNNGNVQYILHKKNGDPDYWALLNNSGNYKLNMGASGNSISTNFSGDTIPLNTWNHICITFDRDNGASLYQNGTLLGTLGINSVNGSLNNTAELRAGENHAGNQEMTGHVDDIRIYNRKLTHGEILGLMSVPDIESGLIGHWQFNETSGNTLLNSGSLGSSGNGLATDAGNIFNFSSNSITGVHGKALSFDATDDAIDIPYNSVFQPASAITVSQWVYFNTLGGSWQTIIGNTETGGWSFNEGEIPGKLMWSVFVNGTYSNLTINSADLNTGRWYHLVGTYGDGKQALYLDGVLQQSVELTGSIVYPYNNSVIIGAEAGTGSGPVAQYFNGNLDETRIYNRALSAPEVKYLFQQHSNWSWSPEKFSLDLWLDADDLSNITLDNSGNISQWNDKSGNGNHAVQTTVTKRPYYRETFQNGRNTVTFDGIDDSLDGSGLGSSIGNISVLVVLKYNTYDNLDTVFMTDGTWSTNSFSYMYESTGNVMSVSHFGETSKLTNNHMQNLHSFTLNGFVSLGNGAGSSLIHYYNGKTNGSFSNITLPNKNLANFNIGSWDTSRYLDANIAELIIIKNALSTVDRQKLEGYLAHKWGLQSELDSSHPYKSSPPK